ncbi:MAG TPA: efflux RND transporter periplasmic adaptor subunit [Candidatus Acidoferrales bacterium]|nr:efflux RND transporter periplasmic adaptor subunit [Candidatus Acidoferrales bacterium]
MKRMRKWLIPALVLIAIGVAAYLGLNRGTGIQNFTAKVERGDINDVVEATGTINAIITVQVGSQVSGSIAKLFADFNSRVHKGEIIALIDPALLQGALQQAKADLENSQANALAADAALDKAKAAEVQTKADYDRAVALTNDGVMPEQQLDAAKASYEAAKAGVDGAVAAVAQAKAQVNQKQAAVAVAQTNLDCTVIRSPIDGTVVARNVDVGQTVAASLQAPTIFTIAQDLRKMWVYTKTDESDVGNIKVGKQVTFKVDAFPKDTFQGVVSQVRMNATTVQSVVTYDTMIEFANPDLKLFPGMTAYVTIPVATVHDVVKLPNTALRYEPPITPEEVLAIYRQNGIEGGGQETKSEESGSGLVQAEERVPSARESAARTPNTDTAVVWKLRDDNTIIPVKVSLGITDHAFTEVTSVLKGELKEGDSVVIRSVAPKGQTPGNLGR